MEARRQDGAIILVAVIGFLVAPLLGYFATTSPEVSLVMSVGLFAGVVFIFRPTWAVFALLVGTSFDSTSISTGFAILGAGDIACLMLLPIWVFTRLTRRDSILFPLNLGALVGYLVLAFASMMLGVNPEIAQGGFARLLIYAVTVVAVVDLLRDEDDIDRALAVIAFCSLCHALIALYLGVDSSSRLGGLVDQPNLLGVKMAFGLFPMVAWIKRAESRLAQATLVGATVIVLIAIILTVSRGTYISVTLAFLWFVRNDRRLVLTLAAIGLTIFVGATQIGQRQTEDVQRRLTLKDESVANRSAVAMNAAKAALENPLLGVGFGQFSLVGQVMDITSESGRGAHSFYLSTAASTGLPALLLLLLFAGRQLRTMMGELRSVSSKPASDDGFNRRKWILTVVSTMMIYHGFSLTIRGSQRLTEWAMLGLYAAIACYATAKLKAQAQSETQGHQGP